MNTAAVRRIGAFAAYGLLGLPLAMAALPVYVQIPTYYASQLGVNLAITGWVLFIARLFDTFQDPLLGRWIDHLRGGLNRFLILAAITLALAFLGLWLPPVGSTYLALWLGLMLIVAYTAHSMLNIAYLTWGARLADSSKGVLLGAAAWREGAGLIGVIIASVIPSLILAGPKAQLPAQLGAYSLGFAVILGLAVIALLTAAPAWQRPENPSPHWREAWGKIRSNRPFLALLLPYFLNAVSVAIPATLALFFINDRLQAPQHAGAFLASYFVAAAVGLPLWVALAQRIGLILSWRLGMGLAIVAFCGATQLGAGDIGAYFVVCIAAGLALGADLALPPVLLAQVIAKDEAPAAYFGFWTLLGKLALAVSGLALPVLAYFNYQPGHPSGAILAWVYAGVPCVFKLIALLLLMRSSLSNSGARS